MIKYFLNKYNKNENLVKYFVLTYVDRALSFALPISILFIMGEKYLYTQIEVAFSYATIALVIIELGLSNYLFWGYKESLDKADFLENAKILFNGMLAVYSGISIIVCSTLYLFSSDFLLMFILIAVRTLFSFYINFYSNIYRLTDRPSRIYLVTITINVSSFFLLLLAHNLAVSNAVIFFYVPSIFLIGAFSLRFRVDSKGLKLESLFTLVRQALTFSWPIMLNVLAMSFISNYAKIYSFGHLSDEETVQISYILRIGLLIQLGHSAIASFFSKSLFMDKTQLFNFKIFRQYSLIITFSLFAVLLIILITNSWFGHIVEIPLDVSTFLFIFYIVIWCFIGYLEIYFGVKNANRLILCYSLVSSAVYIFLLRVVNDINLLKLSIFMVVAGALNICLVITGLIRLGVFKKSGINKIA